MSSKHEKKDKGKKKEGAATATSSHAEAARQLFALNKRAVTRDYSVNPIHPRLGMFGISIPKPLSNFPLSFRLQNRQGCQRSSRHFGQR